VTQTVVSAVYGKTSPDGTATGPTTSPSLGTSVAGQSIYVAVFGFGAAFNLTAVTDSKGNTYTRDKVVGAAGVPNCAIYSCDQITNAGASHTVTVTQSAIAGKCIGAFLVSGSSAAPSFDKDANASSASSPMVTGTTATLSQADELVIAVGSIADTGSNGTLTETGGYTLVGENENVLDLIGSIVYKIVTATTAVSCSWTWSAGMSDSRACIATYKADLGGAGLDVPLLRPTPQFNVHRM